MGMEFEAVNDSIEVEAFFGQHGMRPVRFIWQGKSRLIRQVTCTWNEKDGMLLKRYFSVSDGETLYELRFDSRSLRWHLTKVALEG